MAGDQGPPPYEVLAALAASLRHELAGAAGALEQARAELAQARERLAELEARLRQNPRNSSRPPSGEGLAKPAPKPRSLRKKSGRKPGGQDGHNGTTLAQVASPDREIRHEPGCCGRRGARLAGRPVTAVERRQVLDLPPARTEVTEHQLIERECGCGHRTKGTAPPGAETPVQYGPRIAAVIVRPSAASSLAVNCASSVGTSSVAPWTITWSLPAEVDLVVRPLLRGLHVHFRAARVRPHVCPDAPSGRDKAKLSGSISLRSPQCTHGRRLRP